jgi:hypothetical protein
MVGWTGNPGFEDDVWAALYKHSDGLPRRLNMLAGRVLLQGAIEDLDRIDVATVEAVAGDMAAEREPASVEPAIPAVPRQREPDSAPREAYKLTGIDTELRERVAMLEERMDEQEAAIRRVLTLLIDWVERDEPVARHTNAR